MTTACSRENFYCEVMGRYGSGISISRWSDFSDRSIKKLLRFRLAIARMTFSAKRSFNHFEVAPWRHRFAQARQASAQALQQGSSWCFSHSSAHRSQASAHRDIIAADMAPLRASIASHAPQISAQSRHSLMHSLRPGSSIHPAAHARQAVRQSPQSLQSLQQVSPLCSSRAFAEKLSAATVAMAAALCTINCRRFIPRSPLKSLQKSCLTLGTLGLFLHHTDPTL
jgi:hypothetical protein